MKKLFLSVLVLLAVSLVSGCATLADAEAAKGTGSSRVYQKPYDTVWSATVDAVKSTSLQLVSDDKDKGVILAQHSMSMLSYGEEVAIYVEKTDSADSTRVEVISKKAMATNVFATNWETVIIASLDDKLK